MLWFVCKIKGVVERQGDDTKELIMVAVLLAFAAVFTALAVVYGEDIGAAFFIVGMAAFTMLLTTLWLCCAEE